MNSLEAGTFMLICLSGFILITAVNGQTVTCKTQFLELKHSVTTVICPANCWEQNPALCGNGVYASGPICLAAMHDQRIDNSGGVVQVFRSPNKRFQFHRKQSNGVQTKSCSASKYSYTFSITCATTGDCELPITEVHCPAKCAAASYTYTTGKYFTNSSVCAAARRQGMISASGGKVVIYSMQAKAYNTTQANNSKWFSFEDFNVCSFLNPCANSGKCVNLLADFACQCPARHTGKYCETDLTCWDGNYSGTYKAGNKSLSCIDGWLVIQHRESGKLQFNRTWVDYKRGFESTTELWLGLEAIHQLTKAKPCRIQFNMTDYASEFMQATYKNFSIGPESDNYRLNISGYVTSSTAPDAIAYTEKVNLYPNGHHNGMQFSTYDKNNDIGGLNCAKERGGGWWYGQCDWANLNAFWGNMWPYTKWYAGGPKTNKKAFKIVSMQLFNNYFIPYVCLNCPGAESERNMAEGLTVTVGLAGGQPLNIF